MKYVVFYFFEVCKICLLTSSGWTFGLSVVFCCNGKCSWGHPLHDKHFFFFAHINKINNK